MRLLPKLLLVVLAISCKTLHSQDLVRPFHTHNLSPLVHFFGISPNGGGIILTKNDIVISNCLNIANNASSSQLKGEAIYLDGEMYRNELVLDYGLLSNLQFSMKIPIVRHSSGFLDPMIEEWHESLNLPGKSRKIMKNGELNYFLIDEQNKVFDVSNSELSIGDISIAISSQLLKTKKHALSLKANLKFANAKRSNLVGSGTNDFGLQLSGSINPYANRGQFSAFYSLAYLRLGSGSILDYKLKKNINYGSFGLALNANNKLYIKTQLDFHSSFYKNTATKQLGKNSAQLALGLDYRFSNRLLVTCAFVEDIVVNTAPDFVLHFGISYKFK